VLLADTDLKRSLQPEPLDTVLSQFHPPPILTAHFPKIHLSN
jgi:hypothetical protein